MRSTHYPFTDAACSLLTITSHSLMPTSTSTHSQPTRTYSLSPSTHLLGYSHAFTRRGSPTTTSTRLPHPPSTNVLNPTNRPHSMNRYPPLPRLSSHVTRMSSPFHPLMCPTTGPPTHSNRSPLNITDHLPMHTPTRLTHIQLIRSTQPTHISLTRVCRSYLWAGSLYRKN